MTITGLQIVQAATKYKGVPYFEGNPQGPHGMDCSGLVQAALGDLGVKIGRTTSMQLADANTHVVGTNIGTDMKLAQQGDILHYVGHEEIYVTGGPGGIVFSEATNGTVADYRSQTPWPIIGIVRYADGGAGQQDVTVTGDPTGGQLDSIVSAFSTLNDLIGKLGNAQFWARVGVAFLGVVLLALGLYKLSNPSASLNAATVQKAVTTVAKS